MPNSVSQSQPYKQKLLSAYQTAIDLESFPSGKYVSILKMKLGPDEFVTAMDYIADFSLKSLYSVLPEDVKEKIDELATADRNDDVGTVINTAIVVNDDVAQAADNGLVFACKVVANANNIKLEI